MSLRRNILIFHQAALGDFVVTWPIAVAMGRMYPQSRVIYVTAASKGRLAEKVLGVESADVDAGQWHLLHAEGAELPEASAARLTGAHTILTFVSTPHDAWEHNVRRTTPDSVLINLSTKPPSEPAPRAEDDLPPALERHVTASLLRQLRPWPVMQAGVRSILRSVVDRGLSYRLAPEGAIVLHPGAG